MRAWPRQRRARPQSPQMSAPARTVRVAPAAAPHGDRAYARRVARGSWAWASLAPVLDRVRLACWVATWILRLPRARCKRASGLPSYGSRAGESNTQAHAAEGRFVTRGLRGEAGRKKYSAYISILSQRSSLARRRARSRARTAARPLTHTPPGASERMCGRTLSAPLGAARVRTDQRGALVLAAVEHDVCVVGAFEDRAMLRAEVRPASSGGICRALRWCAVHILIDAGVLVGAIGPAGPSQRAEQSNGAKPPTHHDHTVSRSWPSRCRRAVRLGTPRSRSSKACGSGAVSLAR